jgi:hypothetical protein
MPGMYGRAMVFLDAAPDPLPGAPPVHWTLLQGEGRPRDDRYNSIYRLGVEGKDGLGSWRTSKPRPRHHRLQAELDASLPVRRWTCVEWHMEVASNEMQSGSMTQVVHCGPDVPGRPMPPGQ